MTSHDVPDRRSGGTPATAAPPQKTSRAGRNLPAAIASGVVLGAAIIGSLAVLEAAFMLIVVAAVAGRGLGARARVRHR